jgi:hypothetical protein
MGDNTNPNIDSFNESNFFTFLFYPFPLFAPGTGKSVEIVRRPLIPVLSYLSVAVDKESELRLRITSTTEKTGLVKQKTLRINASFM